MISYKEPADARGRAAHQRRPGCLKIELLGPDGERLQPFRASLICAQSGRFAEELRMVAPDAEGRVTGVPKGRYHLRIEPMPWERHGRMLLAARTDEPIEVRPGEESAALLRCEYGGRLRACVRLEEGVAPAVRMWTRPLEGGASTAVRFFQEFASGLAVGTELPCGAPLLSYTLLAAGRQELVVEAEGLQLAVRELTILPRRVLDLDLALDVAG